MWKFNLETLTSKKELGTMKINKTNSEYQQNISFHASMCSFTIKCTQ